MARCSPLSADPQNITARSGPSFTCAALACYVYRVCSTVLQVRAYRAHTPVPRPYRRPPGPGYACHVYAVPRHVYAVPRDVYRMRCPPPAMDTGPLKIDLYQCEPTVPTSLLYAPRRELERRGSSSVPPLRCTGHERGHATEHGAAGANRGE